jgi:hypothetical protein
MLTSIVFVWYYFRSENWSSLFLVISLHKHYVCFVVLLFELRTSRLLDRCSTTCAVTPALISIFEFFLFIYSHVHTLFGLFLYPALLPHPAFLN